MTADTPAADPEKAHVAATYASKRPLIACRFDPKGRFVFASAEDRNIVRWDLGSEAKEPIAFADHDGWVFTLGFLPDGDNLLLAADIGDGDDTWLS